MRHVAYGLLLAVFAVACQTDRLVNRPEDCPEGCYTADDRCVAGRDETACGRGGLTCGDCGATGTCVDQACVDPLAASALRWAAGFEEVGREPLAGDVTKLTTLQPEEDARAGAEPLLYGLRAKSADIVSLGRFDALGESVTTVSSAVGPDDEGHDVTFDDVFAGNRRLLMTGYVRGGAHRLFLYSTDTQARPVGTVSEAVAGGFAVAPMGDFFFLSAPGLMGLSGAGVYGFLDGPSINGARQLAAWPAVASTGPGLMATARGNVALFGARVEGQGTQRLYACTLTEAMDAFTEAANHPWNLALETCARVYEGGAGWRGLTRMADGFAVLEGEALRFVALTVEGEGAAQRVTASQAVPLADAVTPATIEQVLDYGDDVLVVVRTPVGREVYRGHRLPR